MPARTEDSRVGQVVRANVDRLLGERGMSVRELCDASGFSRRTFSQLFKTPNGPRLATLERLARALGCATGELVREP